MAKIEWTDDLAVGVDVIDEQHQEWIERFNAVVERLASPDGATQLPRTLDFLVEYTSLHFATEEAVMTESGYPGLEAHRAKHDDLKRTLADLVRDYVEEGATHILADATGSLLRNWLLEHIQSTDKALGSFVRDQQAAS